MTSITHPARHHIAWLYFDRTPVSGFAKISGPFFNTGTDQDVKNLRDILAKDEFSVNHTDMVAKFIYPEKERDGIPENAEFADLYTNGTVPKITVKFEYNNTVQAALEDRIDKGNSMQIWIVYQPTLPNTYGGLHWWDEYSRKIIKTTIEPGGVCFNVGGLKTPISSFASESEAQAHVQAILDEKTGAGSEQESEMDAEGELSYGVILGTQTCAIKALVVMGRVTS